jgi:hypothetical protein
MAISAVVMFDNLRGYGLCRLVNAFLVRPTMLLKTLIPVRMVSPFRDESISILTFTCCNKVIGMTRCGICRFDRFGG